MKISAIVLGAMTFIAALVQAESTPASPQPQPFLQQTNLTGDWMGMRPRCCDGGLEFFGSYTAEVWGNTSGGIKTGAVYDGLLTFGANLDLEKAVGWTGASMSTSWLWISGQNASEDLTGNLLTLSSIAGDDGLRMFTLWFQQKLFGELLSIRAGQLAADSEFFLSDYSALFLNSTFGWPGLTALNMPNGGPGYPMGTLGVRLAVQPTDWFTWLFAAFQGNVFAQDVNRYGFRWNLSAQTGYTFLTEAQVRWNHEDSSPRLPGQLKLGAWFQTGQSADPLSSTPSSGNEGFYAILDQLLWRPQHPMPASGSKDSKAVVDSKAPEPNDDRGIGFFTRVGFAPPARNFIDFYIDTGLSWKGLIPTRDQDIAGIGFAYAQLSDGAMSSVAEDGLSPMGSEMILEATYQAKLTPWLSVQPDLQYVINPGATSSLDNAWVVGGRISVVF